MLVEDLDADKLGYKVDNLVVAVDSRVVVEGNLVESRVEAQVDTAIDRKIVVDLDLKKVLKIN